MENYNKIKEIAVYLEKKLFEIGYQVIQSQQAQGSQEIDMKIFKNKKVVFNIRVTNIETWIEEGVNLQVISSMNEAEKFIKNLST